MSSKQEIIVNCKVLLKAYQTGKLGQTVMPEDSHPQFLNQEENLVYFTLPMALNYQRDSYKLWGSALITFNTNPEVFSVNCDLSEEELREVLTKNKVALQPNKHIATWRKISKTVSENWGSLTKLLESADNDYLQLRELLQIKHKKGFPYLSGPKIFNYWCFILMEYCDVQLKNSEFIEIAPDTHITKCSLLLGIIDDENLSKEQISLKWRDVLHGSGITPIQMHPPLWFWSRNGFLFKL
jgi:hypothetical protein